MTINNKILLVEDDRELRETLRDLIELSEIKADISESAEVALRYIEKEENKYNLILSDYLMPGMSGLDLFSKVRRLEGYEDTPFFIISARTDQDIRQKCIQAGISGFLNKPFEIEELIKLIRIYI